MLTLLATLIPPVWGYQMPPCGSSTFSEQQIKEIIDKARTEGKDLPPAFPESKWTVRRQGCYYIYTEHKVPATPDANYTFKLNQKGSIVDFEPGSPKCPQKVFSQAELSEIVGKARASATDIPPPFANQQVRVDRLRCLYLYFEYAVPERRGDFQLFTIDPLGELMEFHRSKPY